MSLQPLWLDYQQPSPGRQWPGVAVLVLSMLLSGGLLTQYLSIVDALETTEQKVSLLKRQAERKRLFDSDTTNKTTASTSVTPAIHTTARWEELFSALEKAGDDSVTLLGLVPGSTEVSISGEAKDLPAALDYLKRLRSMAIFSHARITEQELLKDKPYHPLHFTLVTDWKEPMP